MWLLESAAPDMLGALINLSIPHDSLCAVMRQLCLTWRVYNTWHLTLNRQKNNMLDSSLAVRKGQLIVHKLNWNCDMWLIALFYVVMLSAFTALQANCVWHQVIVAMTTKWVFSVSNHSDWWGMRIIHSHRMVAFWNVKAIHLYCVLTWRDKACLAVQLCRMKTAAQICLM